MPVNFWLSLVLVVGIALVFVIQPVLFYRRREPVNDRRIQNLDTYRSRLRELERERDDGLLDESNFEALRDELELSLLQDVEGETANDQPETKRRGGRRGLVATTLGLCLAIPVSAFVLYAQYGSREALASFQQMESMRGEGVSQQDVEQMVQGLSDRLGNNPDDTQGWAMLARSYMQLQRPAKAADAYRGLAGAMERTDQGDPASAWGLRAQALFVANQGRITEAVKQAIDEARSRNPDEINARALMGISAFRDGAFRKAVTHWERILEIAPDHPQADSIRSGLAAAYSQLGEPIPPGVFENSGEPAEETVN